MNNGCFVLERGQLVDNQYKVEFSLFKDSSSETYRVKDQNGEIRFLKLISYAKLEKNQFVSVGEILEVELLKTLSHPNIVEYIDFGNIIFKSKKYGYLITKYICGETLHARMQREGVLDQYLAKEIILGVLDGVKYLHQMDRPIIHNNITNKSVSLDLSKESVQVVISELGAARWLDQNSKDFNKLDLNLFYLSNEALNSIFSPQSDIFSIGCLFYHLLTGRIPWFFDVSRFNGNVEHIEEAIIKERNKKLPSFDESIIIDKSVSEIIQKALHPNPDFRFQNVQEFIDALSFSSESVLIESLKEEKSQTTHVTKTIGQNGFADIAGMNDLKDLIQFEVIDAISQKEKYETYGLSIPNGILLYGPPGCGKTFFAKKLAEEISIDFFEIKPSDIQSKWVNASQENIKNLFDEARKNAPCIIFIDELDAILCNRENEDVHHMNSSIVNEFLAQMDNVGDDGIFIIGATNRPHVIDPAILRSGRLDKHVYVSPPDYEARKGLFRIYLKNRPLELGIDYNKLAELTNGYVSSDVKNICDKSARIALKQDSVITEYIICNIIKSTKPSISPSDMSSYIRIKEQFIGSSEGKQQRPKIGF